MRVTTSVIWPSRWERRALGVLLALVVAFGVLVVVRSALLRQRLGDLSVYLRAAWAVRVGGEVYDVTEEHGWHYNYPPALAILLTPLADPPAGADRTGMLPYSVSAGIWYVFNLLCLALAVHWLAAALERTVCTGQPAGSRAWWALRVLPVLICLPPVGHNLMRGQVNVLMLALLGGAAAGLLSGQRFRAGLCLAGMACIKVFPAYLLVYPVWKRDVRCLAGAAVGLFLGLVALPVVAFGPTRAVEHYQKWARAILAPGLGAGEDRSRALELINITATGSQSFQAVLHNTLHLDRATRPAQPEAWVRHAHWLIGGVLTLVTLLAARRRRDAAGSALLLGALSTVMVLLSPVCHLHNLTLCVVPVMGLIAWEWQRAGQARLGWGLTLVLGTCAAAHAIPQVPRFTMTRDVGLAMYGTLLLWLTAVVRLGKRAGTPAAAVEPVARAA
jgi:hypothetical protein